MVLSKKVPADGWSRIKGKAVRIRRMPAVAVIGDENCTEPLFGLKGEGAATRMIPQPESLPFCMMKGSLLEYDPFE